jgi:chaperonin cofactor prefoldin
MSRPQFPAQKKLSEQPAVAACHAEIAELSNALARTQTAIEQIEAQLRAAPPTRDGSGAVADALHFAQTGEVRQPNTVSSLQEQHLTLRWQRDAVEAAIREKRRTQTQLASELSGQLCKSLDSVHRKLAGRYVKALQELDALHEEERALFDAIEAAGYSPRFASVIAWPHIGTLRMIGEAPIWNHLRSIEDYAAGAA